MEGNKKMKLQDVQRRPRKEIQISLRTDKGTSKWLRENRISPQSVFDKAIEELIKEQINNDIIENGRK